MDNHKFGGFTYVTWDKFHRDYKRDNSAFIFSLDLNKKYPS